MKTIAKLVVLIGLSGGLISAAFGSWSHAQNTVGQYSGSVYVPSAAHVQQVFQAFNYSFNGNIVYGQVVNDGPLGSFNCTAGPQQSYSGDIGGGANCSIYQVVMGSGYSVTTITW